MEECAEGRAGAEESFICVADGWLKGGVKGIQKVFESGGVGAGAAYNIVSAGSYDLPALWGRGALRCRGIVWGHSGGKGDKIEEEDIEMEERHGGHGGMVTGGGHLAVRLRFCDVTPYISVERPCKLRRYCVSHVARRRVARTERVVLRQS